MTALFPTNPAITLFDPLAELLGAGDGHFRYTFDDVVKLSGHACPTVAGAFLMSIQALQALYGNETPRRGEIRITLPGAEDQGVYGPTSQVFTLVTGAAAGNGFHGLGGRYARYGLLDFTADPAGAFIFQRTDNGEAVRLAYDPTPIPPDPDMAPLLQRILQGNDEPAVGQRFRELWRARVIAILADGGAQTVSVGGR